MFARAGYLQAVKLPPRSLPLTAAPEERERYLHGDCWLVAVALAERLELEPVVLVDAADEFLGRPRTIHCFVVCGEDGIDVDGRRPLEEIIEEWEDEAGYDAELELERETIAGLRARIESNFACSGLKALPEAKALVERWLERTK